MLSGVGTLGSGHVSFIKEALASREAQDAIWRICSWHKNQRLMQVGHKGNEVGWEPYEECRRGGAIIATGHEHSYSRTHLMDSFETQSIASTSTTVRITRGNSFAFVSGLGGLSIRGQDDQLAAKAWWAAVHTSAQGADFGALFCTFNHKAVENRGHCYFKDLNGVIADEFEVVAAAASETPRPPSPTRPPTGVKLPTGPTNINYDIASDVPAEQVEIITAGLQMGQEFLDSDLGGGIPEDARNQVTVKIVATGRGNEEPGGDGACCTGLGKTRGVSTMRPFFDVAHPQWVEQSVMHNWATVVHEYTHIWQHHLGCISIFHQPLGGWLNEGIATYVAAEAMVENGYMQYMHKADMMEAIFRSRDSGQLDRPLRDFSEGANRDMVRHPGRIGALAIHRLVQSAPGGILSLRTICEEAEANSSLPGPSGVGMYYPEAFETAFGVALEDFYADFEKYRTEINAEFKSLSEPTLTDMGFTFDVGPDVPADQVEAIKTGLQIAQNYFDLYLDGGIPEDARKGITVKIVATGQGNQDPGGRGRSYTTFGDASDPSVPRPFYDVAHDNWAEMRPRSKTYVVMRHYMRLWQHQSGCHSRHNRWPLGRWLNEGISRYLLIEIQIKGGYVNRSRFIEEEVLVGVRSRGELSRPLRDFEGSDVSTNPINVGYLAVDRLVQSAPDGILSLKTVCEEAGSGASLPEAFETAFGISLEDFYAEFDEYRKELNQSNQ